MLPADKLTISPTVTSFIGISFSSPFLNTFTVVATSSFSFSAALFDLNSSKNSNNVLVIINTAITIILAQLGSVDKYTSVYKSTKIIPIRILLNRLNKLSKK